MARVEGTEGISPGTGGVRGGAAGGREEVQGDQQLAGEQALHVQARAQAARDQVGMSTSLPPAIPSVSASAPGRSSTVTGTRTAPVALS